VSPWEFIAHHPQNRGKIPVLIKTAFTWAAIPAQKGINIQKKLSSSAARCSKSFIFLLRRG
jgi:hypothetical protein